MSILKPLFGAVTTLKRMMSNSNSRFINLKSLAECYIDREGWQSFGRYCLQKERGLKKPALDAVQDFIAQQADRTVAEQRALADELAGLVYANPHIHALLAHPLKVYLQQVFSHWAEAQNDDPRPHRWLGFLTFQQTLDRTFYQRALLIDPDDQISLRALVKADLDFVAFQTHHLSESRFLGELALAYQSLQDAEELIARLDDIAIREALHNDVVYFRQLLDRWATYTGLTTPLSFAEWCLEQGFDVNLGAVVYFNK